MIDLLNEQQLPQINPQVYALSFLTKHITLGKIYKIFGSDVIIVILASETVCKRELLNVFKSQLIGSIY
jgi:hypothetical protein